MMLAYPTSFDESQARLHSNEVEHNSLSCVSSGKTESKFDTIILKIHTLHYRLIIINQYIKENIEIR